MNPSLPVSWLSPPPCPPWERGRPARTSTQSNASVNWRGPMRARRPRSQGEGREGARIAITARSNLEGPWRIPVMLKHDPCHGRNEGTLPTLSSPARTTFASKRERSPLSRFAQIGANGVNPLPDHLARRAPEPVPVQPKLFQRGELADLSREPRETVAPQVKLFQRSELADLRWQARETDRRLARPAVAQVEFLQRGELADLRRQARKTKVTKVQSRCPSGRRFGDALTCSAESCLR